VTLLELALYFGLLSLLAFGGLPSVLPEMHRYVVEVKSWASAADFIQLFAIAQAAPGPNILFASLVGWKVSGLAGAVVALGAICAPAAVLAWWVADAWEKYREAPWRLALQRAIAPLVVGLILSGGYVLATPDPTPDWRLWLIAGASAAGMLLAKVNPLWLLAGGGALGALLVGQV
jgi:chromate transporter